MPTGCNLTQEQIDAVLRLANQRGVDGEWLLTYDEIAAQLGLHRRTIYRCIRSAATKWGQLTKWMESADCT